MATFKSFLIEEQLVDYDYSSLLFEIPEKLTDNIISWGFDNISDDSLFHDPKDLSFGREDDIHVTLIYGLHTNRAEDVAHLFEDEKPFECKLGEIKVFDSNPKFDVLIIQVECQDLHRLNKKMRLNLDATENHPIYKPHVTICYLKKGEGDKFKNKKCFQGEKFIFEHVYFSSKSRKKTSIKLGVK